MAEVSIENERTPELADVEQAARELDPARRAELAAHAKQLKTEQEDDQ